MKNIFDTEKYILAVARQDAEALQGYFAPDAIVRWHDSNEEFTADEYIRANCEYPGAWDGEVHRVEEIKDGMVVIAKISSDDITIFVTSFFTLKDGKISRLDEYYSTCEEVPEWRQKMNIGKPIN